MSNLDRILDPRTECEDDNDSDHSEDESVGLKTASYEKTQADILSQRTVGKLTGPKGVIADYKYSKQQFENIELDIEDETFLKAYREKRIAEITNTLVNTNCQVVQLTFNTYNEAIDSVSPQIPVIIHLYETHISECQVIHIIFKELAKKYPLAKFCEIPASHTQSDFDDLVLPTILAYKDKKLVANMVRFVDELETASINLAAVEHVLVRAGVLSKTEQ